MAALLLALLVPAVAAASPALAAEPATAPGTDRIALTPGPYGNRTTIVYRPTTAAGANRALMIMLTGRNSTGAASRAKTQMDTTATREGFVTAYPDPLDRYWSAGEACCRTASMRPVDDVAFLEALRDQLVAQEQIDPARVYVVGHSGGGVMGYKWVCERRTVLAGYGAVGGANFGPCPGPAPLTVIALHGAKDNTFPVNGGVNTNGDVVPSVNDAIAPFKTAAGCPAAPTSTDTLGRISSETWSCATGHGVLRSIIANEGHGWPPGVLNKGYPNQASDTSDFLWARFSQFAPPANPVPAPTTTALSADEQNLTAAVTPVPTTGGTVEFRDGGNPVSGCQAVAVDTTTGLATCPVSALAPGTHQVTAGYTGSVGFAASQSGPITVTVGAGQPTDADLAIDKTATASVTVGGPITYTLAVVNNGPAEATGVTVTDALPPGVSFVSASTGCTTNVGTVTCDLGTLAANGTGTAEVIVSANAAGSVSNTATVTGAGTDPTGANNSDTATTQVAAPPSPGATCGGTAATITGTQGADIITGTAARDIVAGLGGNDRIDGKGGDDLICGDDGDDKIGGSDGIDTLFGGAGNDQLSGGAGNDSLDGGPGTSDQCDGNAGTDTADGCESQLNIP